MGISGVIVVGDRAFGAAAVAEIFSNSACRELVMIMGKRISRDLERATSSLIRPPLTFASACFPNSKHLVSHLGLNPTEHSSGGDQKFARSASKEIAHAIPTSRGISGKAQV